MFYFFLFSSQKHIVCPRFYTRLGVQIWHYSKFWLSGLLKETETAYKAPRKIPSRSETLRHANKKTEPTVSASLLTVVLQTPSKSRTV